MQRCRLNIAIDALARKSDEPELVIREGAANPLAPIERGAAKAAERIGEPASVGPRELFELPPLSTAK